MRASSSPARPNLYARHDMQLGVKVPKEALTGRNQIAKGNCVTVMCGGEEAGGEPQTG